MGKEKQQQEEYSSMVNGNTILLSFEGWIKFIEGFTKGISTTKTVEASAVLDCVGEILEYMQTLRGNLFKLLEHCELALERSELLEQENLELKKMLEQPKLEQKDGKEV